MKLNFVPMRKKIIQVGIRFLFNFILFFTSHKLGTTHLILNWKENDIRIAIKPLFFFGPNYIISYFVMIDYFKRLC